MGAGAAAVLEGLRALQPTIEARAAEMEEHGVPPELYDRLVATRCFEALVPAHLGGLDLSLVDLNEIVITASRADGSIGWLTMIGCHTPLVLSRFPSETVDELLANGLDVRARGSIAPKGVAVPVEGGYVVSGQWPFASGGPNPRFVAGHCLVLEEGRPKIGPDGVPQTLFALMPAEELTFLDTWHVMGMKATDSCDVAAHEVFVPARRTFDLFSSSSSFSSRLGRLPLRAVLATGHASVAVGIAMGRSTTSRRSRPPSGRP